jgi:amidophosphoribosyltransferase
MCGLIGVVDSIDAPYQVFAGLLNLQHRGQDGAGILSLDESKAGQFKLQKGSGLVENVFSERTFRGLKGSVAVGHSRYATIGNADPNMLQPFLDHASGIGIAHNGNIVNYYQLRDVINNEGIVHLATNSDSEVILALLARQLRGKALTPANLFAAIKDAMNQLVGSYAVIGITQNGDLFGFRDPNGVRPLSFGQAANANDEGRIVRGLASESVALKFLDLDLVQDIGAGEAIFIEAGGAVHRQILRTDSYSPCMFEWVYFARVESDLGSMSVYKARFQLGLMLAQSLKEKGIQADIVVPVPETSRVAAIALSEYLDIPFREVLIKNRYINRTFILDSDSSRQAALKRKLFPIASELQGKRCLVVDDSIVRGNTAMRIIKLLREAGAGEVILVSTCPPIRYPCYYGIDFPSGDELIARDRTPEEIAATLGADKVYFQTVDGLKRALVQASVCTGCLTGNYPTDVSSGLEFEEKRLIDRGEEKASAVKVMR